MRDLVVDFLRRHGVPDVVGCATFRTPSSAHRHEGRGLVIVDLENEGEDSRQLLRELRAQPSGISTVAIGTPIQLAAQAQEADGWLEWSEPAAHLAEVAASAARAGSLRERHVSPAAERWARSWRTLSNRQRQVLALLGCGLDNHRLADALGVSERAVKAHVSVLLDRFKVDSRTELALIARRAGLYVPGTRWR